MTNIIATNFVWELLKKTHTFKKIAWNFVREQLDKRIEGNMRSYRIAAINNQLTSGELLSNRRAVGFKVVRSCKGWSGCLKETRGPRLACLEGNEMWGSQPEKIAIYTWKRAI